MPSTVNGHRSIAKHRRYALLLGLSGSLAYASASQPAFAEQTTANADEYIVITATQQAQPWLSSAASVERVDVAQQLPGLRIDAAELVAGIPGLQADSRFNYAQDTRLILRGFGSRAAFGVRGMLLTLDGIPLSMPDGQAQTSSILLDEPRTVEVLKGPIAGVYGNAAGGVLAMRSQAPRQTALTTRLMAGENRTHKAQIQADWVGDEQQLRLVASDFNSQGVRRHNSAARQQLALRWYRQFDDATQLIVRYDDNDAPLLQDPSALTPAAWREDAEQTVQRAVDFDTRKSIRHRQGSLSLQHQGLAQQWSINLWRGQRDIVQFLPFRGDGIADSGAVIDLSREFQGVNGRWRQALDAEQVWHLSVGAALEQQDDKRLGYVNDSGVRGDLRRDETGEVDSHELFAQLEWQASPRWQWQLGARYNAIDFSVADRYIMPGNPDDSGQLDFNETSFALAGHYQINAHWSWFASYGEGFETPTLTELAYRNQGSGLNRSLRPSRNQQYESGLKWQADNGWQAAATVFLIDSDDELLVDQSNDGRTTYRNATATRRYGSEFSAQGQLDDNLQLRTSLAYLNAEFSGSELDARRLPGIARWNAYMQLDYQLLGRSTWPLWLSVSGDFRSNVAANDDNSVYAPARTVWDVALRSEYIDQQWQISPWLRLNNVTDKIYVGSVVVNQGSGRAFEPAAGRELMAGIEIKRLW